MITSLDKLFLQLAEEALAGSFPMDNPRYWPEVNGACFSEAIRCYRLTRWLVIDQRTSKHESMGNMTPEELCLFILFVREAAK